MLRFMSGRCLSAVSILNNELRVVKYACASNITPLPRVPKRLQLSLQRNISKNVQENDSNVSTIYKGRLENDIFRVKIFSMTTSVLGIMFQPVLYQQASNLPMLIAGCTVAGFFTFVTPVLLHQLAKRHVNLITYNKEQDNYVAHTTTFFFQKKQIPIAPGEAKVPEHGGMFTSMEVRGIPLMVEMAAFEKKHLIRLLGYDKPLNIEHERLAALCENAVKEEQKKAPNTVGKSTVTVEEKRKSGRV